LEVETASRAGQVLAVYTALRKVEGVVALM
jgi:hypothetical protein